MTRRLSIFCFVLATCLSAALFEMPCSAQKPGTQTPGLIAPRPALPSTALPAALKTSLILLSVGVVLSLVVTIAVLIIVISRLKATLLAKQKNLMEGIQKQQEHIYQAIDELAPRTDTRTASKGLESKLDSLEIKIEQHLNRFRENVASDLKREGPTMGQNDVAGYRLETPSLAADKMQMTKDDASRLAQILQKLNADFQQFASISTQKQEIIFGFVQQQHEEMFRKATSLRELLGSEINPNDPLIRAGNKILSVSERLRQVNTKDDLLLTDLANDVLAPHPLIFLPTNLTPQQIHYRAQLVEAVETERLNALNLAKRSGLERIPVQINQPFDPSTQITSRVDVVITEKLELNGKVARIKQTGFYISDSQGKRVQRKSEVFLYLYRAKEMPTLSNSSSPSALVAPLSINPPAVQQDSPVIKTLETPRPVIIDPPTEEQLQEAYSKVDQLASDANNLSYSDWETLADHLTTISHSSSGTNDALIMKVQECFHENVTLIIPTVGSPADRDWTVTGSRNGVVMDVFRIGVKVGGSLSPALVPPSVQTVSQETVLAQPIQKVSE